MLSKESLKEAFGVDEVDGGTHSFNRDSVFRFVWKSLRVDIDDTTLSLTKGFGGERQTSPFFLHFDKGIDAKELYEKLIQHITDLSDISIPIKEGLLTDKLYCTYRPYTLSICYHEDNRVCYSMGGNNLNVSIRYANEDIRLLKCIH